MDAGHTERSTRRTPRRWRAALVGLTAAALVLAGCSSDGGGADDATSGAGETGDASEAAPAATDDQATSATDDAGESGGETVTVGMLTTLSGNAAYLGEDTQKGFQLALDLAGADDVELVVEDDAQDAEAAQGLADRMVSRDGAQIMTGIVFSDIANAVVPTVLEQDMLYLSTNAGPSTFAGEGCDANYFSVSYQNDNPAEATGEWVKEQGHANVVAAAPNYQAGQDSVNGFRRTFGELQNEFYTELGATDYAQTIAQIRDEDPDAVYFFYPGGMGIAFVQQYIESGLAEEIPIYGPTFSFDETLVDAIGEAAVGLQNGSFWAPDLDNPANQEFVEAYREANGATPTNYAAQGYDTGRLLLSALDTVGYDVSDTEALREAVAAADFDSVRGDFSFGTNQHPVQDWYILEVVAGEEDGDYTNQVVEKVLDDHVDAYASECSLGDG